MTTCGIVTKSLLLLAVVVALTGQGSAADRRVSECCTRVSRQQITETIVDYMVQKRNNHCVNAVIFRTESGSLYCCKHNEPWVMKKVRELRAKKRAALAPDPSLLQLLSSSIGGNHRHALNALYRPIEMLLIQRRPTSSKMADQILLKRKTMNC
ncbi:uncharacterized protein LOC132452545 isoform X2 [Gadus macrocephalus]|uniref:uncharacterized protein LOC132452545 isoform X2 n=1 Tax=Gadus macrocephalus TaxID=80720 RepID=UPI0028CB957C|nr:uncharacterized protein LOC132452545 isoform X2 [Gadus macrocephalus]